MGRIRQSLDPISPLLHWGQVLISTSQKRTKEHSTGHLSNARYGYGGKNPGYGARRHPSPNFHAYDVESWRFAISALFGAG
jgi:hypothetical protein